MKHQTIFAIGIPTINRADLLQETLEKYQIDFPHTIIYVMDNGNQNFDRSRLTSNIIFLNNKENIGVSASWNNLCKIIYGGSVSHNTKGCSKALILNDDIYLGRKENEILKLIENRKPFSLLTTTLTWCAFIISKGTFKMVGNFDTNFFPAYFEDNDYAYRLKLAKIPHETSVVLNPVIFRNSETIKLNPELNQNFEKNKQYFIQKWGEEPGKEIFIYPFNNKFI